VHGGADENHGLNPIWLQGGDMKKNVSSHAQTDGPTLPDAEIIQKSQAIQGALAMGNRFARIGGSAVTARIGFDERVVANEFVATGVGPIFPAASAAM
jgi:hypothetical protein